MAKLKHLRKIGFSRTTTLFDATAFGLIIGIPLTVYSFNPLILQYTNVGVGTIYLSAFLIFLPILLSYSEYSACAPAGTSPYELTKARGSNLRAFFTGWTQLFGYLVVSTLLITIAADSIEDALRLFLNIKVDFKIVLGATLLLAVFNELIGILERSLQHTTLIWFCVVFAGILLVLGFTSTADMPNFELTQPKELRHWLGAVSALSVSLWAVPHIIEHQYQYKNRDRTTSLAVVFSILITFIIGYFALRLVIDHPDLMRDKLDSKIIWAEDRVKILSYILVMIFSLLALSKSLSGTVRLSRAMSEDGFLPSIKAHKFGSYSLPILRLILIGAAIAALTYLSLKDLLLIGGSSFSLVTTLTLVGHLALKTRELNSSRWLKLPLHPIVPLLAVFSCGSMLMVGVYYNPEPALLSTAIGAILYVLYARKGSVGVRKQTKAVGKKDTSVKEKEFRIGVFISNIGSGLSYLDLAKRLSDSQDGEVLVFRILAIDERLTSQMLRAEAEKELAKLEGVLPESETITPIVRLSANINQGVVEAVSEYEIDYVFLPNPASMYESMIEDDIDDDEVFKHIAKPILTAYGTIPEKITEIAVTAGSGSNAPFALLTGSAVNIALDNQARLNLFRVSTKQQDFEYDQEQLQSTMDRCPVEANAVPKLIKTRNLKDGILDASASADILIMGASVDPVFKQSVTTGMPRLVAQERKKATIIVKAEESTKIFWARKAWGFISGLFPTIEPRERIEVFAGMRHSARADADFYILMSLASAIAILGLLLNSGAVIIGAMLVAPLMNPILAAAQGMVHGNPLMIKRAFKSIIWGIIVALAVSSLITMFLGTRIPGSEILGRTKPNFLDLLVAISAGAAAAFATSRRGVAGALPGVAIAVALVPPLCVVGYGLGISDFAISGGAFLLFLTNLAAIIVVGAAVFLALGFRPTESVRNDKVVKTAVMAIAAMIFLAIPLGFASQEIGTRERIEIKLNRLVTKNLSDKYRIEDITVHNEEEGYLVKAIVYSPLNITKQEVEAFRKKIQQTIEAPINVDISIIRTQRISANAPETTEARETEVQKNVKEKVKEKTPENELL